MAVIRFKRGTLAQLDAAAAANGLVQGEPYFVTDQNKIALGTTVSTYLLFSPGPKITVSDTAPSSPAINDLWMDTNT